MRIAMMAMTTNNSISVKPRRRDMNASTPRRKGQSVARRLPAGPAAGALVRGAGSRGPAPLTRARRTVITYEPKPVSPVPEHARLVAQDERADHVIVPQVQQRLDRSRQKGGTDAVAGRGAPHEHP